MGKLAEKGKEKNPYYTKKSTLTVYLVLRALVIFSLVRAAMRLDFESVFFCVMTLVLLILPSVLTRRLHVELPSTMEIIILLFIFAAEILGELNSFYIRVPHWDTMLHTLNGFLCAAIGFALVDLLNQSDMFSFRLSPVYLALVAFCFSMTVGVLWEFFEFFMDTRFATDMQKDWIVHTIHSVMFQPDGLNIVVHKPIESLVVNGEDWIAKYGGYIDIGLIDTMKDLIVNFIGAVTFSVIGFFYAKKRGQGRFASAFIPRVRETFSRHKDKS